MVNSITSILFDLDGTLVDSVPWHEEALNRALEEVVGFRIGDWENKEIFSGKLTKDKLILLTQQGRLDLELIDVVISAKKKHLTTIIAEQDCKDQNKIVLFSKILLYKTACITNSNRPAALEVLSAIGLTDVFDLLVTGNDVRYHKPSSEGYVIAMVGLQSLPKETLIVEDSFLGLQAAKNTGAHVWLVTSPEEVTWDNLQSFLREI